MNAHLPDDEEPIVEGLRKPSTPVVPRPPERPSAPAAAEPRPQTSPEENDLRWGTVGLRHTWGPLAGDSGEEGVIRIVEVGVSYTRPPREAGLREWQAVVGNPQRFEMSWSSRPRKVRSLEELGHDLGQNPPDRPDDPRLADLDRAVDRLLQIAGRLHQHGFRLGLLHPRNILLVPSPNDRELVLPDYGFAWKSGPFRPAWVGGGDFVSLWDREPESQQEVTASSSETSADVRTLGRLFACVLTGVAAREVPERPPAASRYQTQNAAALARVWDVLARAGRGQFQTADEFAEALRAAPLSHHVFAMPPPPPPPAEKQRAAGKPAGRAPYALVGVGGAVLLGLLAVLLLWKSWDTAATDPGTAVSSSTEPAVIEGDFDALRAKYRAAAPEAQAAILRRMYDDVVLSADPEQRREQQAEREQLRREFLQGNWLRRYREAEQLGQELPQRFTAGKQFRLLRDELTLLQERPPTDQATDAEEKQCLTFSGMRVNELGFAP